MATAYIQPGSATGNDGSTPALALGYADNTEREAASTLADDDGTIIFLDGTYEVGSEITVDLNKGFDGSSFSNQKWKAQNAQNAILSMATNVDFRGVQLEGFKILSITTAKTYCYNTTANPAPAVILKSCLFDFTAVDLTSIGYGGKSQIIGCTFLFTNILNLGFYFSAPHVTAGATLSISDSSFYINGDAFDDHATFNSWFYNSTTVATIKNSIFVVGSASVNADLVWNNNAGLTWINCCCHDFSGNAANSSTVDGASTETGMVFADPQFVDLGNKNLNLRPSSPCLAAGVF